MDKSESANLLGRRAVLAGAGVLAGAAAAETALAGPAERHDPLKGIGSAVSPIENTIASPPLNGRVYRFLSSFEFLPLTNFGIGRQFGGDGQYAPFGTSYLSAFCHIAPGALWRDVEFYVRNARSSPVTGYAILWRPDVGAVLTMGTVGIAPNASVTATLLTLSSSVWGPYPHGVKAGVMIVTQKDETVQINGARFGFSNGGGETSLQVSPQRVYDSREIGGKFAAGEIRTISMPPGRVSLGTVGAILNVQVLSASAAGTLNVFNPTTADPSPPISFTTNATAQQVTVAINPARQIKVQPSKAAHVVLDLVGTIG